MSRFPPEEAAVPYQPPPDDETRSPTLSVKERHERRLLAIPGVEGVGLTERADGPAILLYLHDEAARAGVPAEIEGVPVVCEVTGPIEAR